MHRSELVGGMGLTAAHEQDKPTLEKRKLPEVQLPCGNPSAPKPDRPCQKLPTSCYQQQQVVVQHVQLPPQRRDRLGPRGCRHEVQVASDEEYEVEGARGHVAHAVALVTHHADDGLDDGQEACR